MKYPLPSLGAAATITVLALTSCGGGADAPAAVTPLTTAAKGSSYQDVSWLLLGTRRGGGALSVRASQTAGSCASYRVLVDESSERVRVRVQRSLRRCAGDSVADIKIPDRLTAKLRAPLDGRTVTGPKRSKRVAFNVEGVGEGGYEVPNLIGLSLAQAREVAKTFATSVKPSGTASEGYVVSQLPDARTHGDSVDSIEVGLSGK